MRIVTRSETGKWGCNFNSKSFTEVSRVIFSSIFIQTDLRLQPEDMGILKKSRFKVRPTLAWPFLLLITPLMIDLLYVKNKCLFIQRFLPLMNTILFKSVKNNLFFCISSFVFLSFKYYFSHFVLFPRVLLTFSLLALNPEVSLPHV